MYAAVANDTIGGKLRAVARDGGLIETAQVRLLGLDEIRAAAGPRWPRMRERVQTGSMKIIESQLGADDVALACGEGFVIVFAETAAAIVIERTAQIREALLRFYLGEEAFKTLGVETQRAAVSAESLAALAPGETAPTSPAPSRIDVGRCLPVWSIRSQGVAALLCAPFSPALDSPSFTYNADFHLSRSHGLQDFLDLDLCLVDQAIEAVGGGRAPAIGVTVHASTLHNRKARCAYLAYVDKLDPALRERMFVTVAEIEPGTPQISLSEWTQALRQIFPRIGLDLHVSDHAIGALRETGAWAAGFRLPMLRQSAPSRAKALEQIEFWSQILRRQGLCLFVHGFTDQPMLRDATARGLDLAVGAELWPPKQSAERLEREATATTRRVAT